MKITTTAIPPFRIVMGGREPRARILWPEGDPPWWITDWLLTVAVDKRQRNEAGLIAATDAVGELLRAWVDTGEVFKVDDRWRWKPDLEVMTRMAERAERSVDTIGTPSEAEPMSKPINTDNVLVNNLISVRVWRGRQAVNYQSVETLLRTGNKIRITVKLDAYDFQSYGLAEVWNGLRWNQVHRIAGEELAADYRHVRYDLGDDVGPGAFAADRLELVRVTRALLGD